MTSVTAEIWTNAVPVTEGSKTLVAVTLNMPAVVPAVKRPLELIEPPLGVPDDAVVGRSADGRRELERPARVDEAEGGRDGDGDRRASGDDDGVAAREGALGDRRVDELDLLRGGGRVGDRRFAGCVGRRGRGEGAVAVVGEGDRLAGDVVAGEADAEQDGPARTDGADAVGEGGVAGAAGLQVEPLADGDDFGLSVEERPEDGVAAAGVEVDGQLVVAGAERRGGECVLVAAAGAGAAGERGRRAGGGVAEPVAEWDGAAGGPVPEDDACACGEMVVAVAGEGGGMLEGEQLDVEAGVGEPVAARQLALVGVVGLVDRQRRQHDCGREPEHVAQRRARHAWPDAAGEHVEADFVRGVRLRAA